MAKQTLFDLLRDALLRGEVIRSGVFARRHGVTRAGVIRALHMFGGAVTMQGQSEATTWVCVWIVRPWSVAGRRSHRPIAPGRTQPRIGATLRRAAALSQICLQPGALPRPRSTSRCPSVRHSGLSEE